MSKGLMILPIGAGVIGQDDVPLVRIMDSDETPTTITVYGVVDTVQPVTAVTWTVNGVEQSGDVSRSPVLELTNLQPETSYAITLRASNINGESSASARTITTKKITTVTPNDVLEGVSYYNLDVYYTGNIPTKDENDIVVNGREVTVPTGYYPESETVSVSSEYIIPTGTKNISDNGTEDVTQYAEVNVNVQPNLDTLNVTPSTSSQDISPTGGVDGFNRVMVAPVGASIDQNIQAGNIKKDVTILGVTGTFDPTPTLTAINVIPTKESQVISPTGGVDGFDEVNVYPVTALIDRNITPDNIKKDVAILGVTGTFEGGIQPTGTYNIIANGTYDITNYANVNIQVPQGDYNFLCFTANEANCTVGMQHFGTNASTTKPTLSYSTDKQTWNTWDGTNITLANQNDKVYFFGNNLDGFSFSDSNYSKFTSTGDLSISGNLMTLITMYGDREYLPNNYCFYSLFNGTTITDASNLLLQVITLTDYCYRKMFQGCSRLTSAPALPATTLANYCYADMFTGSGLTSSPALPATILSNSCYSKMFSNCTSLTSAPALPATTLTNNCYENMFRGCTSLTTAPELPATTLASSCYNRMFNGCTSLTTPPSMLPAKIVPPNSYIYMFDECFNLTRTPIMYGLEYQQATMTEMFDSNSVLNTAIVLCENWPNQGTSWWLRGVAATGTFYKPANLTNIPIDNTNGIPTGWTVVDMPYLNESNNIITFTIPSGWSLYYTTDGTTPTTYSTLYTQPIDCDEIGNIFTLTYMYTDGNITINNIIYNFYNYFHIEALEANTVLNTSNLAPRYSFQSPTVEYSTDKKTWSGIGYGMSTYTFTNAGDKFYLRKVSVSGDTWDKGTILTNSGTIKIAGLLEYAVYREVTGNRPNSGGCGNMFQGCTGLVDASGLVLFGTNYQNMFNGCTALTSAPALPATTLTNNCYENMFQGCTSLTIAPELPATTLTSNCYKQMFYGCSQLNLIKVCATSWNSSYTTNWVNGVAATGTFIKPAELVIGTGTGQIPSSSANGIPAGWSVEDGTTEPKLYEVSGGPLFKFVITGDWPNDRVTRTVGDIEVYDGDDVYQQSDIHITVRNGVIDYDDDDWNRNYGQRYILSNTDRQLVIKTEMDNTGWYTEFNQYYKNCDDWQSRGYSDYEDCMCNENQMDCPPEP